MSLYEMLWLAVWTLILFVVGSFGFLFGYLWRKFGEKKTITEAVKAVRDYEVVKTENECLRDVIAKRDAEIAAQDKQIKILEACNEDMVPHNCKCGKKPVIDDEVSMVKYEEPEIEVEAEEVLSQEQANRIFEEIHNFNVRQGWIIPLT
jgi:hypothetical protein